MNITLIDLHNAKTKGFTKIILKNRCIFINRDESEATQRMVCAHEIGHIAVHPKEIHSTEPFYGFQFFNIVNHQEYEANLFAAYLLIDEKELISLIHEGYNCEFIADCFQVDEELITLMILDLEQRKVLETNGTVLNPPSTRFMGR